ncbi:uncharacterized protein [Watersipora subatra]|uniref:uncharacterized protein n=1 Tax=Watersipora subatra TaxID=2589382 RepID=UPI00355C7776
MHLAIVCLIGLALSGNVASHSWIACTDYLQENGDYWSSSYCRAYARHGHQYTNKENFGTDTGYNYVNPQENQPCFTTRDDANAYNSAYPMAVYYPGQKVVVAHPTKNHVAETCTNQYIPDNGNFVYRSDVNPVSDPTLSAFKNNEVVDLGISPFGHDKTVADITTYPKPGYQNAPKFCENTDKALATSAFYIPTDLQSGRYTFLWSWSFNSVNPSDTYTSCWEADVVSTKSERDNILSSNGLSTNDPELLHGVSLAPLPPGVTTTQSPVTTSQESSSQASTSQASTSQGTSQATVSSSQGTTSTPTSVPDTLLCLDACLHACY